MKVYISGPITGHDDYMENFEELEQKLRDSFGNDIDIVNPAKISSVLPCMEWKQYMDICLTILPMCAFICMMEGWEHSTGACIEDGYALASGIRDIKG